MPVTDRRATLARGLVVGRRPGLLEIADAWLVDPATGREGMGAIRVEDGMVAQVGWRRGGPADPPPILVTTGLADLHAHVREHAGTDRESTATVLAAAARGGFTTVCLMANTQPPTDRPELITRLIESARASGSPVRALPYGTVTQGRAGTALAPLAALAAAGAVAFSDDGSPVDDPGLLRAAITEAGFLGRVMVEHPEDRALTEGAEASEGLAATILGLRGAPPAAEWSAVGTSIAVLRQVAQEAPAQCRPRLHLTHLSTAASVALVRAAKAEGLPVTCDTTPHHLALHDGWVGGDRRFSWEAIRSPWAGSPSDAAPYDPSTRVNPPLRSPADALALAEGLLDGTVDAIATDHAPHREMDKEVEFGDALPGISGLETCVGLVLAAVEAGVLSLGEAIRALTLGPWCVLGEPLIGTAPPALQSGRAADLVVIDRTTRDVVDPTAFASRGRNTPLAGTALPGRVLLTVADGRVAFVDEALGAEAHTGRMK